MDMKTLFDILSYGIGGEAANVIRTMYDNSQDEQQAIGMSKLALSMMVKHAANSASLIRRGGRGISVDGNPLPQQGRSLNGILAQIGKALLSIDEMAKKATEQIDLIAEAFIKAGNISLSEKETGILKAGIQAGINACENLAKKRPL
jgi:hypothetical protein